ncbi:hypothetical protein ABTX81_31745 [Kitasatospora sp. NPDC097605]|uniref:hypothetical protein n=1 Tax=Kitasatospora sp. NPDC097605 TaxID=3157226 RepID=UPI00331EEB9A
MAPAPALTGLDTQPRSSCSHTHGSAEDVPALLHALTGEDADAAGEALSELYGSLLHQGTVYATGALAVPFPGLRSAERDDDPRGACDPCRPSAPVR